MQCTCNSKKMKKYSAFFTALQVHGNDVNVENFLYRELNYKQLWCAILQKDTVWEITLCLKIQLQNNALKYKVYKAK